MRNGFYKIAIAAVALSLFAATGAAFAVTIDTSLFTSPPSSGGSPAGVVSGIYRFALAISGILAFGAIVYGAIRYTLAAGNPGGQKEGREWMTQALVGLLLLAGAYLILNTLNPQIFTGSGAGIKLRDLPALTGELQVQDAKDLCLNSCRLGYSCYPSRPPNPNNPNQPITYSCVPITCFTGNKVGCPVNTLCVRTNNKYPPDATTFQCQSYGAGTPCETNSDCDFMKETCPRPGYPNSTPFCGAPPFQPNSPKTCQCTSGS